jgi:ectoine hydroxylase-related dioxygenase (phytanoyl-CoA dioxygenase family)
MTPLKLPVDESPFSAAPAMPWVESDRLEAYLAAISADDETTAFCRRLAATGLAGIDLGSDGRELADRVVAETEPYFADGAVTRVQDAWLRRKAVKRLASHPKLIRMLTLAYGRTAFAFQTLSFRRGTRQALHSDAIHFHSAPPRFMCGVWIALEDISPEAGPLRYVEGSHRLPILTMQGAGVNRSPPTGADYGQHYLPALERRLAAAALPEKIVAPKKGEAVVWAANLVHGGAPILNPAATRRSLVVHMFFKDCLYYTPMTSAPEQGLYDTRLPMNVGEGGWVWPRLDGRRVAVPRGPFVDAMLRRFLRRPDVERGV